MLKTKILFLFLITGFLLQAQEYVNTTPPGFYLVKEANIQINNIPPTQQVQKASENPEPLQIGETIDVLKDFNKAGKWTELKNGKKLWQLIIKGKDVNAINAYLSEVNLSGDDEIFIYCPDPDQRRIHLTSTNQTKRFGTSLFKSDKIIIEFLSNEIKELPFVIREIGLFKSGENRDFGNAAWCEISVNCPEGEDYNKIKNSVSRILVKQGSSLFWCTGSLINNTKKDKKPYLLTANHCGDLSSEDDYSDWVFDFNFESEDCDKPLFEPEKNTVYGSKLLAKAPGSVNSFSDFKLLLLDSEPPSVANPFYVGWDRRNSASANGAGIHHPQGDIKMISTYSDPLLSTNYFDNNENTDGKYWRVVWSDSETGHGVTEGGSSGSAIYNSNGLLVGTLTGGQAACNLQTSPDWYGKFSYHWESNGSDSTTQLKYWLDPIGSGSEVLNGSDFDSTNLTADFTSSGVNVTIGGAIEYSNLSVGNITSYKWYFEGGNPLTSDKQNPDPVRYFQSGSFDVKLVVESANGADSLTTTDLIHVGSLIYPSISKGQVNIKVGDIASEKVRVKVFNALGQRMMDISEPTIQSNGVLGLMLSGYDAGAYVILLDLDGFIQSYKFILVE